MVARTRGRSTTSAALIDRWMPWIVGALAVLVYAPVLRSGFRFDDHHLIVENALLREPRLLWQCFIRPLTSTEVTSGMYRPLTMASYTADYAVGGLAPAGYHLVNLLLHAVNAWLGYRLVRLMRPQVSAPAVAAGPGAGTGAGVGLDSAAVGGRWVTRASRGSTARGSPIIPSARGKRPPSVTVRARSSATTAPFCARRRQATSRGRIC